MLKQFKLFNDRNKHTPMRNGLFLKLLLSAVFCCVSMSAPKANNLAISPASKSHQLHTEDIRDQSSNHLLNLLFTPSKNNCPDFWPLFENETEDESAGKKETHKVLYAFNTVTATNAPIYKNSSLNIIRFQCEFVFSQKKFIRLRVLRI